MVAPYNVGYAVKIGFLRRYADGRGNPSPTMGTRLSEIVRYQCEKGCAVE